MYKRQPVERFETTASAYDKPRSQRPSLENICKSAIEDECERQQSEHVHIVASSHLISNTIGISRTSVCRIFTLSDLDMEKRVKFSKFILNNSVKLENILGTDVPYFVLSGSVKRHNSIICGSKKTQLAASIDMHSPTVCMVRILSPLQADPLFHSKQSNWPQLHGNFENAYVTTCLLYTSPSPRD